MDRNFSINIGKLLGHDDAPKREGVVPYPPNCVPVSSTPSPRRALVRPPGQLPLIGFQVVIDASGTFYHVQPTIDRAFADLLTELKAHPELRQCVYLSETKMSSWVVTNQFAPVDQFTRVELMAGGGSPHSLMLDGALNELNHHVRDVDIAVMAVLCDGQSSDDTVVGLKALEAAQKNHAHLHVFPVELGQSADTEYLKRLSTRHDVTDCRDEDPTRIFASIIEMLKAVVTRDRRTVAQDMALFGSLEPEAVRRGTIDLTKNGTRPSGPGLTVRGGSINLAAQKRAEAEAEDAPPTGLEG